MPSLGSSGAFLDLRLDRRVLVTAPVGDAARRLLAPLPHVEVREDLARRPAALPAVLSTLRPHTLVVGANAVDAAAITAWVRAMRGESRSGRLLVVRRGTSLAAIDTVAARLLDADVVNTPEVNARYVAEFVVAELGLDAHAAGGRPATVGLIGAGAINGRVARAAATRAHRVLVHAPSLVADPLALQAWATHHGVPVDAVVVAGGVGAVFAGSDLVSIAVPLVSEGPHPTRHLVDAVHVKEFAGSRIVSVSEPAVLTESAVLDAYARRDLTVVIDNAPALVEPVRRRIVDRVQQDHALRPGFTLSSAALRVPGCAEELDQAFLTAVATAEADDRNVATATVSRGPARDDRGRAVAIVGGGIVGLTIALALRTAGWRNLRVFDAASRDGLESAQGTTFGGADARHLSLTETTPHADGSRRDVLTLAPADGGWQLRDATELSDVERAWIASFEGFTERPGLRALTTELAVGLNRLGIRGWEALFARHPGVFGRLRRDSRLGRAYLTGDAFAAGFHSQSRASATVRALAPHEVGRRWPALVTELGSLVPLTPASGPRVRGVVEVDGYSVNIHQLAGAVRDALVADGVTMHAGSAVRKLRNHGDGVEIVLADGSSSRAAAVVVTVGGRELDDLLGADALSSGVVQRVLGVFLTLPNPGLHHPLKVHGPDPVGVMNIVLSQDSSRIHVSGGFGYLGLADPNPADRRVAELAAALEDLAGQLFPALRQPDGSLDVLDRRVCTRPMTPDGLPVLEALDAFDGRVVVAAGTNAGGAVQAPALATLVERLLCGERGVVHQALRPDRASLRTLSPTA